MKTIDIINGVTFYYGTQTNWDENSREFSQDPNSHEIITGLFTSKDEAIKATKAKAGEWEPDFGKYDVFDIYKAELSEKDAHYFLDQYGYEEGEDIYENTLLKFVEKNGEWEDLIEEVAYDYKSVEGAILVVWEWEKYIGYARNIREIREGRFYETEELCCHTDKVFHENISVLCTAEELKGLSEEEKKNKIENALWCDYDWRWTLQAERYIRRYVNENYT